MSLIKRKELENQIIDLDERIATSVAKIKDGESEMVERSIKELESARENVQKQLNKLKGRRRTMSIRTTTAKAI